MSALRIGLVVVAIGLLAGGVYYAREAFSAAKTPEPAHRPAVLGQQVHGLGRLEPAGRLLQVAAPSGNEGARVDELRVQVGDVVHSGDVLAVLDTYTRRAAALAEAKAQVATAEAALAQVRAGAKPDDILAQQTAVELARTQREWAEKRFDRVMRLRRQDSVATQEFLDEQLALDRATLEVQQAERKLASLRDIRQTDVRAAEQQVEAAKAAVARAEADLATTLIRAPAAGRILFIYTYAGERIGADGLLDMGDTSRMHAVAEIFEADVHDVALGMPARVVVDSSGRALFGRVHEIGQRVGRKVVLSNDPVSDTDARVVEVRIELDEASSRQVQGLSNARVRVTIALDGELNAEGGGAVTRPGAAR